MDVDQVRGLRLATFNVRHCTLGGKAPQPVDIEATAHAAAGLDADVVAVQELDVGLERSGHEDQPARLAALLGMHCVFSPAIQRPEAGVAYGSALYSRTPIEGTTVELPEKAGREPRVAFVGATAGLSIVATHLAVDGERSEAQLRHVVDAALALAPPRAIVGDLNRRPHQLAAARAGGFRPVAWRLTFPRTVPNRQIDYVLTQSDLRADSAKAVRTPVSDHRPLVVTLRDV